MTAPIRDEEESGRTLERLRNVCRSGPLRLHLGCGEAHLADYVNVDFPPSEHTVQQTTGADVFADVTILRLPSGTVEEVRLHHLFEHFDRVTALAQLCRWHRWLRVGGLLWIETPDVDSCARLLASPDLSYAQRMRVVRHLFGSHEARWAYHLDGWFEERFRRVLSALGFEAEKVEYGGFDVIRNVTVRARKTRNLDLDELLTAAMHVLRTSLVDESETEVRILEVWCSRLRTELEDVE